MNRLVYILIAVLLLSACKKEADYNSYSVTLTADFDTLSFTEEIAGATVKLFNQNKSYTFTADMDETGIVSFTGIEPGFYNVSITHSFSDAGEYYNFNGTEDFEIFSDISDTVTLTVSTSSVFVIKEFYYSGCLTPAGKQYTNDQYVEIFNNSPAVQYADGLSLLEHESYATDENYWDDIEDTIVVKMIWTIPGTGTDVPVQPGESIILARTAIDHQTDENGNSACPVNLGDAEFEFFVERDNQVDIDGLNAVNLEEDLFVFRGTDIAFHTRGGSAIAIAKIPGDNQDERMEYIDNHLVGKLSASGSSTQYYGKIATKYIYDAVEITWDEAHAVYKRFPTSIDAGYTYVPSGSKSGKCVRRKIKEVEDDGRVVYQDTNNSTEDFEKDVDPNPKVYE